MDTDMTKKSGCLSRLKSRDAGVQGIYGPGSNIVECAADVLRLLGYNMPPVGE
jgi:methylmalonyl-CoA mutase cobalamin-binding subunit